MFNLVAVSDNGCKCTEDSIGRTVLRQLWSGEIIIFFNNMNLNHSDTDISHGIVMKNLMFEP